jgi:cytochrome c oxidase subunit 2
MPVFGVAGVVFVVILGGALFIALKFRARDDDDFDEMPAQIHGHFKAEIGWTIAPAVVLAVIGAFTVSTIIDLAKKPPADALEVEVWGQQWWWEYRYHVDVDGDGVKETIITANDMVIPTDREISLKISSHDVIHSWWSPRLNGKKDAVPGRVHPLTINAPDPGEYIGQCTEFCGLSHAEMRIKVVALEPADFQAWLEQQVQPFKAPTSGPAADGFGLFASQCTTCHRITGMTDPADPSKQFKYPAVINQVSKNAPNLTKFMTRTTFAGAKFNLRKDTKECRALGEDWANTKAGIAKCLNRADLEAWLRNPPAQKAMYPGDQPSTSSRGMPNFNLSEDQIDTLVAFLTTLK